MLASPLLEALKEALFGPPVSHASSSRVRRRSNVATVAGGAIVALRERLKLTQAELAELIGSEQKAISKMESGRTFVSTRILERMAEHTGSELRVDFLPK